VQLLDAGAQADAEPFAPSQGDQGMGQLVGAAVGVFRVPGIQVDEKALAAPGRQPDQHQEAGHHPAQQQREQLEVDPADEEDADGNGADDDEGAQVGLQQQQHPDQ